MFDKEYDGLIWFVIGLMCFSMYLYGGISMEGRVQRQAVKANVAYWTVDESGFTKFHWITE